VNSVTITRAGLDDVADLAPLVEAYRAFYRQPPSERTRDYVADRIAHGDAVVLLARKDGVAVGFALVYPTFSTVALAPVWLLNDLYVSEHARGGGVAGSLMAVAEQVARDAGAARIWLRTAHDNRAAQGLYESRGWAQDEVFRRYDLVF
jgi:ribosomal protein S18 acetylase RimI-like enzyme